MKRLKNKILAIFSLSLICISAFAQPGISDSTDNNADKEQQQKLDNYDKGAATEINVKNADINAIIKIFSKKTNRNYILDEKVKGKVSLFLPAKVSEKESIHILDAILDLKGFTTVPIAENLWKILPKKEARQTTIPTVTESEAKNPSATVITRLLRLKYVSAEDMQKLLTQLVSSDGLVSSYSGTNSLVIIDSADNIKRLEDIVDNVDIPSTDRDVTIIPIKYADAKEIADRLLEILGEGKSKDKGGDSVDPFERIRSRFSESGQTRTAQNENAQVGKDLNVAARTSPPKIIADERTNSIIIVADEESTDKVRALISKLDSRVDLGGVTFYVYRCQHAKAEDLASVLSGLSGGSGSSTKASNSSNSNSDFGSTQSPFGASNSNSRSGSRNSNRSSRSGSGSGSSLSGSRSTSTGSGVTQASLGENISITADPSTNSLIINASYSDYQRVKTLIDQLDIKRRQVLVEAMLLEVGVDNTESLGAEFITSGGGSDGGILARNQASNLANLLKDPAAVSDFSLAAASAGTIKLPGGVSLPSQAVLISAAKTNSNVNVLSAPNILTADNEEAQIVVGQNIPFISSTSSDTTNLNNTFNQVERQDVGITLRITPQISSGDSVTLKVFSEVSGVISSDPKLGPTTTIRTSETTVITKDGQMIVIGGLMSDDVNSSDTGVPYLKDIPVLGTLFRTNRDSRRRTNLLIFITPRIVQDQFDARQATIEKREKMQDVIANNNSYPDRQEVLTSFDIDRVSESTENYTGPLPGTITAPVQIKNQEAQKSRQVLKLKVGAKQNHVPTSAQENQDLQPRAGLAPNSQEVYVVLQKIESDSIKAALPLPFAIDKHSKIAALEVPADAAPVVKKFFQAGDTYSYMADATTQVHFKALGVYASKAEAENSDQSINKLWYTLSPYEIMGIGKDPWTRLQD